MGRYGLPESAIVHTILVQRAPSRRCSTIYFFECICTRRHTLTTLAGKLVASRSPSLANLKYHVARQWACIDNVELFDLGKNLFSFQSYVEADKLRALNGGPWYIYSGLLLLAEVDLNTPIEKASFAHTPLWVRIHDLLPNDFNEKFVAAVDYALGVFCGFDAPSDLVSTH